MSNGNQLILFQTPEEFKYKFFSKQVSDKTEEITNEESAAEEMARTNQTINEQVFGGQGGTIDDFLNFFQDSQEEVVETQAKVVKVDELVAEEKDPFLVKTFESEKVVFASRPKVERDPITGGARSVPEQSRSNEWVRNPSQPAYGTTTTYNTGYGGTSTTTNTAAASAPKPGEQAHIFSQIPRVQNNFQNVAMQTPIWTEDAKKTGWEKYEKQSWWKRAKTWLQSKKGRIMTKVTLLAAMQLGMAWVGKRYAFENLWQAGAFLSMMLGTFYITKELQADGFDPRGFGI